MSDEPEGGGMRKRAERALMPPRNYRRNDFLSDDEVGNLAAGFVKASGGRVSEESIERFLKAVHFWLFTAEMLRFAAGCEDIHVTLDEDGDFVFHGIGLKEVVA